jgi:predicted nucleic acid-binding protein
VKLAYVDSSAIVAIAFDEPGATTMADRLAGYDVLFSSPLLEAELLSALCREQLEADPSTLLDAVSWVVPGRRLTEELQRVYQSGYVRGADAWHLACAVFLAPAPRELDFVTLDLRQRAAAQALGFGVH